VQAARFGPSHGGFLKLPGHWHTPNSQLLPQQSVSTEQNWPTSRHWAPEGLDGVLPPAMAACVEILRTIGVTQAAFPESRKNALLVRKAVEGPRTVI
jgi:hypothetical protein